MRLPALVCFILGFAVNGSVALFAQTPNTEDRNAARASKITNKDVLEMHAAGLGDDVITEKITTSTCNFDTSPSALVQFKTAGISDWLALAMIRCGPTATSQLASFVQLSGAGSQSYFVISFATLVSTRQQPRQGLHYPNTLLKS